MSVSPTSSHVYVNYTSLFSQGGNNSLSMVKAAASNYSNGAFQVRSASMSALDVLDLSPQALAWTKPTETAAETEVTETDATNDVTLESPEMTEAERVEIIRVNKNAVLDRVNTILAEKGVEVSEDPAFDLKVNFMDGSISVTGVEDEELAAAMNEALVGDEELITLMRKTRDELGLQEQENTVPRNFTIQFDSMLETPADAELEFKIDLFVNKSVPQLESAAADPEAAKQGLLELPGTFEMSLVLSNRGALPSRLNQLADSDTTAKNTGKEDESIKISDTEEEEEPTFIIEEDYVRETSYDDEGTYSIFGNWFKAASTVTATPDGLLLDWSLQFSNWDMSGNLSDMNIDQRIFETLNVGGSVQYGLDPTTGLSPVEQAAQLQSLFSGTMNRYFSQDSSQGAPLGEDSGWAFDFLDQNGLGQLGLIPS